MLFADDFSVVRIFQGIRAELLFDLVRDMPDQCVFYFAVAQNLIRCHAGLAAVQIFSENDTLCGKL